MTISRREFGLGSALLGLAMTAQQTGAAPRVAGVRWLGAWGTALTPAGDLDALPAGARIGQFIVASLAGSTICLHISNSFGDKALTISEVELHADGRTARAQFGGLDRIAIPAGASVLTDPVDLPLAVGGTLELSLLLPEGGRASAVQRTADRKGGWIDTGTGKREVAPALFSTVDVRSDRPRPVVVILSDTKSAGPGTWPELLAARAAGRLGVVNRSVFGGHLALGPVQASALARFERDVLATSGASHVVIFAGNNDLIQPGMIGSSGKPALDPAQMQSAEQLIALLKQAVARTRAAGMIAVGATWLPYEGVTIAQGYSTPEKLAIKDEVNVWIRSRGAFDVVLDFDAALCDATNKARLAAAYDSGNHFTPNAAGYARMAEIADRLLR